MSSLPWICAVTLALLCCLTAQPLKPNSFSLQIQSFSDTVENDTCWEKIVNPTYYAPVDVKKECVYSALDCYIKEFYVLVEECQSESEHQSESEQNIEDAADDLMTALKSLNASNSTCTNFTCEVFPQKPFKEFLNNMATLLQQIMSQS